MNEAGSAGGGWIAATVVSLLGLLGGFGAWLATRKDRSEDVRTTKLDAWHKELLARENLFGAQQAAFQARVDRHLAEQDEKIAGLEAELEKYRIATPALVARIAHHDPHDPILAQVAKLLGRQIPLTLADRDQAMDDLIKQLDK